MGGSNNTYIIQGGNTLKGNITPQGAKNEALQVFCAVLLTDKIVTIENIPQIQDVLVLKQLLENLGVVITQTSTHTYTFKANNIRLDYLKDPLFYSQASKIRGSLMLLGPLLGRYGMGIIPKPGGDKIGRRKIGIHLDGFKALGTDITYDQQKQLFYFKVNKKGLIGTSLWLEEASVTGTGNILMAAVLAKGQTTIYNAACEPYIQQLCLMLNNMGAKITGIGSNLLQIEGVNSLYGCTHKILPDMIEVGSWISLAATTQSDIHINGVQANQLGLIPNYFQKLGVKINFTNDGLHIPEQQKCYLKEDWEGLITNIADAPWPGLSPDMLSVLLVTAIRCYGNVLIHQKMFESRLFFTDRLIEMGAKIILCDPHRAMVIGMGDKFNLRGIVMTSPDIRAGIALLIAALAAKGQSTIQNIEQIDRGYENIEIKLKLLGADIIRI